MSDAVPEVDGFVDLVRIGRGGFSTVYRAHQPAAGREVALKVLEGEVDGQRAQRFHRECQVLGALSHHPGICTLYSFGQTADGRAYLALELCAGSVHERVRQEGRFTPAATVGVLRPIALALDHAHSREIVHRDVKPSNILLTQFGVAVLADFGIARVARGWRTVAGTVIASLDHVAPEVLEGDDPTPASDMWSLGSTGYQLLTGEAPFARRPGETTPQVVSRMFRDPPPDLRRRGVSDALCTVLEQAMAKEPADRIPSMAALATTLATPPPRSARR